MGHGVEPRAVRPAAGSGFPDFRSFHAHLARRDLPVAERAGPWRALRRDWSLACASVSRSGCRGPTTPRQGNSHPPDVKASAGPSNADDGAVPAHREDDLITGPNKSAIGTLVERSIASQRPCTCPAARATASSRESRNAPALAGYERRDVRDATAATISTLPAEPRPLTTLGPLARSSLLTPS